MADGGAETLVHGTAISLDGRAALLRGPSGCGKSDLALRCLHLADRYRFSLVADDQVRIRREGEQLLAGVPGPIAGLMEVRGLGILPVTAHFPAVVALLVDLDGEHRPERLPDPWPFEALAGVMLPVLKLRPFEASAPLKLALAMINAPWKAELS